MKHHCAKCGANATYFNEVYSISLGRPLTIYLCKKHLMEVNEKIYDMIGVVDL